jgi:hypothetical protein
MKEHRLFGIRTKSRLSLGAKAAGFRAGFVKTRCELFKIHLTEGDMVQSPEMRNFLEQLLR